MIRLSPLVYVTEDETPVAREMPHQAIVLRQIPSAAFGDGRHPTTRLCAGAVDLLCRQSHPRAVLDVGTGTGVLARIARARGVLRVVGTDIDPEALAAARANAELDAGADSPGELRYGSEAPDAWGAEFDLVVANILEAPLRELGPALARALRPEGKLLLSGFTPLQVPFLHTVFEGLGLAFETEATLEGWALVMFRRKPAADPVDR